MNKLMQGAAILPLLAWSAAAQESGQLDAIKKLIRDQDELIYNGTRLIAEHMNQRLESQQFTQPAHVTGSFAISCRIQLTHW